MKGQSFNTLEIKRANKAVCGLDEIFSHIIQAFDNCPEIRQVIFILGSTHVSPKESYLINLPTLNRNTDTDGLPVKTCIKSLFRQLIMQDILENSKPIGTTNLIVLISAPRDSGIEWFLPKPIFKPPERGVQYVLNLNCKEVILSGHDLSKDDCEIEISGIELLELSEMDASMEEIGTGNFDISVDNMLEDYYKEKNTIGTPTIQNLECSGNTTLLNPSKLVEMEENSEDSMQDVADEGIYSLCDQEFMWFQAPFYIKGFKDRSSRQASSTDMML